MRIMFASVVSRLFSKMHCAFRCLWGFRGSAGLGAAAGGRIRAAAGQVLYWSVQNLVENESHYHMRDILSCADLAKLLQCSGRNASRLISSWPRSYARRKNGKIYRQYADAEDLADWLLKRERKKIERKMKQSSCANVDDM